MKKKQILPALIPGLFCSFSVMAQSKQYEVPQEKMNEIYQEVKTPYKYGLVIIPENDVHKLNCPTVFKKGENCYMTYLVFNGRGLRNIAC